MRAATGAIVKVFFFVGYVSNIHLMMGLDKYGGYEYVLEFISI